MRKQAWAWCGYDFANTIFSGIVVTYAYSLYLNAETGLDAPAGLANSLSMLLAALSVPLAGALADRTGNGRRFLFLATALCCLFTGLLGAGGGVVRLVLLFVFANYFYQVGLVFYNSLLPAISTARERGRVSGWGVSLGYVGFIASLLLVKPIVAELSLAAAFYAAAFLFLLCSLPTFRYIPPAAKSRRVDRALVAESWRGVVETLGVVARSRPARNFLLAKFFYNEALNTIIVFLSVYAVRKVGFSLVEVTGVLVLLTVSAVIGSALIGRLVDAYGARAVLTRIIVLWVLVILGMIFPVSKLVFLVLGSLAGALMGGVWVSDRIVLISLAPRGKLNEYFGLYGLVGKASAIFGPVIFGFTADAFGYAWAMGMVLLMFLLGLFFLLLFKRSSSRE